jgi:hypothetical protein
MPVCEYVIDGDDRIVTVCDNWLRSALQNQPDILIKLDSVLERSIWDSIEGPEAQFIYKTLLANIREKRHPITLPYRCDTLDKRRFLELTIIPLAFSHVKFISFCKHEENRTAVPLLDPGFPRSPEYVRMCSMCKKVAITGDYWAEVEVAIVSLKLFEKPVLPQITHGFCPECYRTALAEIEKLDFSASCCEAPGYTIRGRN